MNGSFLRKSWFFAFFLLALGLVSDTQAAEEKIPELKTVSGKIFRDVRITKVTPIEISIMHESGATRISMGDLPNALRIKLGYDPVKAEAYAKAQADDKQQAVDAAKKRAESEALKKTANAEAAAKTASATTAPPPSPKTPAREPASPAKCDLDGFWGIAFGTNVEEAKRLMLAKEGVTLDIKQTTENRLIFDVHTFAGRTPKFVALAFVNDQLHTAKVNFLSKPEAQTQDLFDAIKADIDAKYYLTKENYRLFKSPYADGDGYELQGIKLGKGDVVAFWRFKRPDGHENMLAIEITDKLYVVLTYQDENLAKSALQSHQEKSRQDL